MIILCPLRTKIDQTITWIRTGFQASLPVLFFFYSKSINPQITHPTESHNFRGARQGKKSHTYDEARQTHVSEPRVKREPL